MRGTDAKTLQGVGCLDLEQRPGEPLAIDSAWVSEDLMVEIIQLLARCQEPVKPLAHILLHLACTPVHTTQSVVAAAARASFLLHVVPSLMTSALQSPHVYVYAQLNKLLRDY